MRHFAGSIPQCDVEGTTLTRVVDENCIRCKIMDCVEVCPVDCFYEGENMLVIHPDERIDCGVCVPERPVDAIKPDTDQGLEKWLRLNAEFAKLWQNFTIKKPPPPDRPRTGRGSRASSNTSRQIWARAIGFRELSPAAFASNNLVPTSELVSFSVLPAAEPPRRSQISSRRDGPPTYITTTRRITSGELLKYRNGLLMARAYHGQRRPQHFVGQSPPEGSLFNRIHNSCQSLLIRSH